MRRIIGGRGEYLHVHAGEEADTVGNELTFGCLPASAKQQLRSRIDDEAVTEELENTFTSSAS